MSVHWTEKDLENHKKRGLAARLQRESGKMPRNGRTRPKKRLSAAVDTTGSKTQSAVKTKTNKYKNKIVTAHGKIFDSKKEWQRYQFLLMEQEKGNISELKCQPRFNIIVNGQKICAYIADFSYFTSPEVFVVEDVKSEYTKKLPVYRLKKKLMKAVSGLEIQEV